MKTKPNIGNRILAGLIDYMIVYAFLFVYIYYFGEIDEDGSYSVNGLKALVPIIFWGLITVGAEQLLGRTFGNYAVDLKPVSIDDIQSNISFIQSLKRHLLDPIDMFFFGLIGILIIKNTDKNQRLGDLWAKTIVVSSKKQLHH